MFRAATGEDEDALVSSLDELWQRRIIRAQETNTYDFSHDRIRDVAYGEISPICLPQMHRRIAEALETIYAGELDAVASRLAAHYEQAGLLPNALARSSGRRRFRYLATMPGDQYFLKVISYSG